MTTILAEIPGAAVAQTVLFYILAAVTGASALGLVVTRNIVRSAVCLLLTLLGVAGLYFLLHAEFLAAVQLVVYAGGTLILIVFGVMLTSKSPFSRFEPKKAEVVIAVLVSLVLLTSLVVAILRTFGGDGTGPEEPQSILALGQALLGDYLAPFELASVLLLVVMIGAAYLAKGRRRESPPPAPKRDDLSAAARRWS